MCINTFSFDSLYYLWCVVELIAIVISTFNELFLFLYVLAYMFFYSKS